MPALASLVCGFVFGWGLTVSGLIQPTKVLAFLDVFGAWDPSLAVVMAAALTVAGIGWGLVGLCPGPAVANLATLSLPVIVFVIAMAIGMLAYDLWPVRTAET